MKHILFFILSLSFGLMSLAQEPTETSGLDFDQRINGKEIHKTVEPIRVFLQAGSAVIYSQRDPVAFGTLISTDGFVLTKASEIKDKKDLSIRIDKQKFDQFEVLKTNEEYDLALIKVAAEALLVPKFQTADSPIGSIVISNGATTRTQRRMLVGVISAKTRPILSPKIDFPYMGMELRAPKHIAKIIPKGPAEEAGLKVNDEIAEVDGIPLTDPTAAFSKIMSEKKIGESLKLTIIRGKERLNRTLTFVSALHFLGADNMPKSRNEEMSGKVSKRSSPFPLILQHDTPIPPHYMGGPLLNLEGAVIGINIARANRCETYAIPIGEALKVMKK